MSNYSSDQSVSSKEADHFQRYQFAERIARTIKEYALPDGFVVGVYGKWGEGKTSLLKFIATEVKRSDNTIVVNFNPWLFSEERALISSFFELLATALKENLYTKKEKVFSLLGGKASKEASHLFKEIQTYGKLAASLVAPVSSLMTAAEKEGQVDVEVLKERIESALQKHGKRIVIMVDDIDRLNADEIISVFRLVKLTGHLKYLTYLLAFDENYVANALTKSFGDSDTSVGHFYLEKIIQVPLRLPAARPADMESYCMNKIGDLIKEYGLEDTELSRLESQIRIGLLPGFQTPRIVIRFINACSFSLPLMDRLVNPVDLILIEGIKTVYPELHNLISRSKRILETSVVKRVDLDSSDGAKEFLKQLKQVLKKYPTSAKVLLTDLFPKAAEIISGSSVKLSSEENYDIHASMKVCSEDYFDRYFSYSVAKGDISEVLLADRISKFGDDRKLNSKELKKLFSQYGTMPVLYKISLRQAELNDVLIEKLFGALVESADSFPRTIYDNNPFSLTWTINELLLKLIRRASASKSELIRLAVLESNPPEFAIPFLRMLVKKQTDEELEISDLKKLREEFLYRMLKISDPHKLVGKLPTDTGFLLAVWKETNKAELDSYLTKLLEENPDQIVRVIQTYTPYRIESSPEINFTNFNEENYEQMAKTIDVFILVNAISNHYKDKYLTSKMAFIDDAFENATDDLLLRQFSAIHSKRMGLDFSKILSV